MNGPVYALNLFNVANRDEYLAYSKRSAKEVQAHGGRVVALGKFREAGLEVVMDRCCKIEHARFFGGLRTIGLSTGVITSRLALKIPV